VNSQTGARPELAFAAAQRLPFPEVASRLTDVLGASLTAYLGGVKETRAVREWSEGSRTPSDSVIIRLRLALQIALMISEADDRHVAQAWFKGLNPQLDDYAPARMLRDGDFDEVGLRVE
jgi:hypothetical protein